MLSASDRVLLGRQTERVPAHRMQDIAAAHSLVTRNDVGGGVTLRMAHVQAGAARIREHVEDVEFGFLGVETFLARVRRVENLAFIPDFLPLRLNLVERIRFAALAAHREILNHEWTRMDTNS